jgi:hypothetical protein
VTGFEFVHPNSYRTPLLIYNHKQMVIRQLLFEEHNQQSRGRDCIPNFATVHHRQQIDQEEKMGIVSEPISQGKNLHSQASREACFSSNTS